MTYGPLLYRNVFSKARSRALEKTHGHGHQAECSLLLVSEHKFVHRAQARALAPAMVLGHRARARALV